MHAGFSVFFIFLLFPVFVSFLTYEVLNVSPYFDLYICRHLFYCNYFPWTPTQRAFVPSVVQLFFSDKCIALLLVHQFLCLRHALLIVISVFFSGEQ